MLGNPVLILGIETSCDDTCASVVLDGVHVLSNVISSQEALHLPFGGVYPEVAARCHLEMALPVLDQALARAGVSSSQIDAIAVTKSPGLVGSLAIGMSLAHTLSLLWGKPLVEIDHIRAHLFAPIMQASKVSFPALGVVLSGGHTLLAYMTSIDTYEVIGSTEDDAIGECFDKVASLLSLPYPGGPQIEKLALEGNPLRWHYPLPELQGKPLHFSFSGLKTSLLYAIKGQNGKRESPSIISPHLYPDIAASFQHSAFSQIIDRMNKALKTLPQKPLIETLYFGGGVSSNQYFRKQILKTYPQYLICFASKDLCLDNAAMVAGLAYYSIQSHIK